MQNLCSSVFIRRLIKGLAELIDFVSYGVETGVSSIFFPAASIALTVNERT